MTTIATSATIIVEDEEDVSVSDIQREGEWN